MRYAKLLAFTLLLLVPAFAFAGDGEVALLHELRAISQQFDRVADRNTNQGLQLVRVREQYLECLRRAASSPKKDQPLREMAEIFVLSGGGAEILEPWREGLEENGVEKRIFEGVAAYAEGKTPEAEAKLLPINAASLNPMRGGHLSLAQALLTARSDPKRASRYLQTAALLLPGTLVEEAALRQSTFLAARTGDAGSFSSAAAVYLRRFPRSAYAANFEMQLAFYITRFPDADGAAILQGLLNATAAGWGRCLSCFLISVSEQAVLRGKVDLAQAAASAALPLVTQESPERQRLLLYWGAAAIVTDKFEDGLQSLHSVREEMLRPEDRDLLNASRSLADKLRKTPMALNQDGLAVASNGKRIFPIGSRQENAKRALINADAILKSAN
jgi:chemotaxis protein MotC